MWSALCRLVNSIQPLDLPERKRLDEGLPELEPWPKPNGLPVYVMLPLDSVWLVERERKRVRTLEYLAIVAIEIFWGKGDLRLLETDHEPRMRCRCQS